MRSAPELAAAAVLLCKQMAPILPNAAFDDVRCCRGALSGGRKGQRAACRSLKSCLTSCPEARVIGVLLTVPIGMLCWVGLSMQLFGLPRTLLTSSRADVMSLSWEEASQLGVVSTAGPGVHRWFR
jgi:hypothetical protein